MDLRTYEENKFRLAEIIRSGQFAAAGAEKDPNRRYEAERPWRDLVTRLAEDRFTVVVAGRFNRGKSSLMNALLGLNRLPTGIVPLTSVITYVRYGTSEKVLVEHYGSGLRGEARIEDLPELVTEKGNPGNSKRIRAAEIQLPAEILRRGFFLVDTPGLGSAIFENSQTTERFIPEVDVLILVTSYESPLTEDEIRFLRQASAFVRAVFVVVNKQDTIVPEGRQEVLDFVARTATNVLGNGTAKPFSLSARDGLAAKQANDAEALRASGLREFEDELIRFLTAERADLFLSGMFDRVARAIAALPGEVADRRAAELEKLRCETNSAGQQARLAVTNNPTTELGSHGVTPCKVCRAVLHDVLDFLRQYQYDLSTRPDVQEEHAQKGGFCPLHTWHYEQISSPRGVCTAYPRLLNRISEQLRSMAQDAGSAKLSAAQIRDSECPACKVRWNTEERTIASLAKRVELDAETANNGQYALCLPHLDLLLRHVPGIPARQQLLVREAALLERVAEDMQRYAIKHDALRRHLVSKEENDAPLLALQLLTGHRSVNAVFTIREI